MKLMCSTHQISLGSYWSLLAWFSLFVFEEWENRLLPPMGVERHILSCRRNCSMHALFSDGCHLFSVFLCSFLVQIWLDTSRCNLTILLVFDGTSCLVSAWSVLTLRGHTQPLKNNPTIKLYIQSGKYHSPGNHQKPDSSIRFTDRVPNYFHFVIIPLTVDHWIFSIDDISWMDLLHRGQSILVACLNSLNS